MFDEFRKRPTAVTEEIYVPWKFFYHIPIPVAATALRDFNGANPGFGTPPLDPSVPPGEIITCDTPWQEGNFSIQATLPQSGSFVDCSSQPNLCHPDNYTFWICNGKQIYFDTDNNGQANFLKSEGETFQIANPYHIEFQSLTDPWVFKINYLENNMVWISFLPPPNSDYQFHDFLAYKSGCTVTVRPTGTVGRGSHQKQPQGWCRGGKEWAGYFSIAPAAGEVFRSLIIANISTDANESLPAVVLNGTTKSRIAWSANFSSAGVGDDERLLIVSLIFWAANDRSTNSIVGKTGQQISYIDATEYDMYEIYKFILGLGFPF